MGQCFLYIEDVSYQMQIFEQNDILVDIISIYISKYLSIYLSIDLSIVTPHEYRARSPALLPLMKIKKTTGPLINVLHETAATHKWFF